jgi:hypothetical protein
MLNNITEIICLDSYSLRKVFLYVYNMYWTFMLSFVKLFHFLSVCQHGKSFMMHFIYTLALKLSIHFIYTLALKLSIHFIYTLALKLSIHFIYTLALKLSIHFVFSTTRNIRHPRVI